MTDNFRAALATPVKCRQTCPESGAEPWHSCVLMQVSATLRGLSAVRAASQVLAGGKST